ncbi:uncharacterized protein G2W53_029619 [Senna tora]|uniref:Uncharacterized protein n=1 Tax=Senna tora TaxID=362788 RepID=A0A834T523_9FABA|nr:uncharacterized protein G2W53_029619 [Senna tora]
MVIQDISIEELCRQSGIGVENGVAVEESIMEGRARSDDVVRRLTASLSAKCEER